MKTLLSRGFIAGALIMTMTMTSDSIGGVIMDWEALVMQ
jgi:hypothetical protein